VVGAEAEAADVIRVRSRGDKAAIDETTCDALAAHTYSRWRAVVYVRELGAFPLSRVQASTVWRAPGDNRAKAAPRPGEKEGETRPTSEHFPVAYQKGKAAATGVRAEEVSVTFHRKVHYLNTTTP